MGIEVQRDIDTVFRDLSIPTLVLASIGLVLDFFFLGNSAVAIILAILAFAGFDAVGYHHLYISGSGTSPVRRDRLVSYRTLQFVFQHILTFLLYLGFGWESAFLYNVLWWFGVGDLLYYVLLKQDYTKYGPMFWLWWTPLGLILRVLNKDVTPKQATTQALIGSVISVVLYVLI